MCRMIVAIGEIETTNLLDDLIRIAKGENELHEKNPEHGRFKHHHGWGMAYLDMGGSWQVYKTTTPIYEDEQIDKLKSIEARAMVLHVRRATKGGKNFENTQPLYFHNNEGDYIFAHNGSIQDEFTCAYPRVRGDSDTVYWFNKILKRLEDDVERDYKGQYYFIDKFSSANFFLVTPEKIVIGQNFTSNPKYHTMKVLKEKNKVIVSSEVLPTMHAKQWHNLQNQSIIEVDWHTLID